MKIICVGMNYAQHNKEIGSEETLSEPTIFMKADSALLKDGKPFFIPEFSSDIHYEAELVVKINRLGKHIAEKFAHRYYNEVSIGIDFTARTLQDELRSKGLPWEKCKTFDNSAAVGTFVDKSRWENIQDIPFSLKINEETVQSASSEEMLHGVDKIISHVSRYFTLKIGDLIFTGTPSGAGRVNINDRLEGFLGDEKLLDFCIK